MKKAELNKAFENIEQRILQTQSLILSKPHLRELVDTVHPLPKIYNPGSKVKLIVIGQDPTIVNKASRRNITTVLDLDKPGKMQRYIFGICESIGIDPFKELYATNLFKNFFDQPPSYQSEVLNKFFGLWFPILKEEVALFPSAPVITLGDNVLEFAVSTKNDKLVRNYWGYTENWQLGASLPFRHILPDENHLGKIIFPFPRQPSMHKQFYVERADSYINYVKKNLDMQSHEAA